MTPDELKKALPGAFLNLQVDSPAGDGASWPLWKWFQWMGQETKRQRDVLRQLGADVGYLDRDLDELDQKVEAHDAEVDADRAARDGQGAEPTPTP